MKGLSRFFMILAIVIAVLGLIVGCAVSYHHGYVDYWGRSTGSYFLWSTFFAVFFTSLLVAFSSFITAIIFGWMADMREEVSAIRKTLEKKADSPAPEKKPEVKAAPAAEPTVEAEAATETPAENN